MDEEDVAVLAALEETLWRPETRFEPHHLERTLAADFHEFGASGRHRTREESVAMPAERFETLLPLADLRVHALGADAALLTYACTTTWPEEGVTRTSNRSSVWQRVDGSWRLRFHQGTPTAS